MQNLICFELNNWTRGKDYPDAEPFISWMESNFCPQIYDEKWLKENELCVSISIIDMSRNFCITAKRDWVEKNCPSLLTEYNIFIRNRNKYGYVRGRFNNPFLKLTEYNIGLKWEDINEYEYIEDECIDEI